MYMRKKTELPLSMGEKDFFQLVAERIKNFSRKGKYKTAANYRCALKQFMAFRQGLPISIMDISTCIMKDYQDFLVQKGLKMNTISLYMRMLRAAYNYAWDDDFIENERRPFRKVFTGQEKTRKRALSQKVVRQIVNIHLNDPALEFVRDLFLFSIYMQGMPFVDMAYLKKCQLQNGYIVYRRRKTNQTLKVKIVPLAQKIIDRYETKGGEFSYLFPILSDGHRDTPIVYASALRLYNKRLERISKLINLNEPLTSYVSRHTWASLARACGISDTIISEAMGHTNIETTTIYLAALDTDIIATANEKLIKSLMR